MESTLLSQIFIILFYFQVFDNVKKACQRACLFDCETTQIGPICIDCHRRRIWKGKDLKMMEVVQLNTELNITSESPGIINTNFV